MSKQEISIVKLMDGSTLVGKLSYGEGTVEIEHPIELVPQNIVTPHGIGESINLRPWIAVADAQTFTIDRRNIITVADLQEGFKAGYHRMVKSIYFNTPEWRGDFIEERVPLLEEGNDEMDLEMLEELANAVLDKKIH
jgi:hypothetical protein